MTDQDLGMPSRNTCSQGTSLEASKKPKSTPDSILGGKTIPHNQPLRWEVGTLRKNKGKEKNAYMPQHSDALQVGFWGCCSLHDGILVIKLQIPNAMVDGILIDNGSQVCILFRGST
ncbi:hypothetical protein ACFX11_006894 [Malus domestica]